MPEYKGKHYAYTSEGNAQYKKDKKANKNPGVTNITTNNRANYKPQ